MRRVDPKDKELRRLSRLVEASRMRNFSLERDLHIAAEIQRGLLAPGLLRTSRVELAAVSRPAHRIGGDFYDHRLTAAGALHVAVADVSGKGIPAALMMSNLLACLRTLEQSFASPAKLMERLNRFMGEFPTEMFCTAFLGELRLKSRTFHYANAGHPPGLLARGDGTLVRLEKGGLPLGLSAECSFDCGTVTLGPRDVVLLSTDGALDARSPAGERFGARRLGESLVGRRHIPPEGLLQGLLSDITAFTGGSPQSDDLTLLALRGGRAGARRGGKAR